jgi:hypothetical protein
VWIVQSVERRATGSAAAVRFPSRDFSLLHRVQTGSGSQPASYTMGTGGTGVQRLGREADHTPPSNAKVKNDGAVPPLPHRSSSCGA